MCAQEEGDIMYKKIIILLGVVLLLGTGSSIILAYTPFDGHHKRMVQ